MAPEGSQARIEARQELMLYAKWAKRHQMSAKSWIQAVALSAPDLVDTCGLEDVSRVANFVWSER